jgi:hypothetical protein
LIPQLRKKERSEENKNENKKQNNKKLSKMLTQILPAVSLLLLPFLFGGSSRSHPTELSNPNSKRGDNPSSSAVENLAVTESALFEVKKRTLIERQPIVEVNLVQRDPHPENKESNVLLHPRKRWGSGGWGQGGCCGWH